MSGHLISQTIAGIKLAHQQNRIYCVVKKSKYMLRFLSVLRANCFIYGFACIPSTDNVLVYLRYYKNRPLLRGLKQVSRPGHKRFITFHRYTKMIARDPGTAFVVNSSFAGLKPVSVDALRYPNLIRKISCGELLCIVW